MNKKVLYALILLAISVVVIVITQGRADVNLIFSTLHARASLVYLAFLGVGVAIGALLK